MESPCAMGLLTWPSDNTLKPNIAPKMPTHTTTAAVSEGMPADGLRHLHGDGGGYRLRRQRHDNLLRGTQQLGHQHHRDDAHEAAHQLGDDDGQELFLDGFELQVEGHAEGNDSGFEPKLDEVSALLIGVVTDAGEAQKDDEQGDGYQDGIEQDKSCFLL